MFPVEFRAEVNHEETRVVGLSSSKDPMIMPHITQSDNGLFSNFRTESRKKLEFK